MATIFWRSGLTGSHWDIEWGADWHDGLQGALEQAMLANPALAAQHPELQRKANKV